MFNTASASRLLVLLHLGAAVLTAVQAAGPAAVAAGRPSSRASAPPSKRAAGEDPVDAPSRTPRVDATVDAEDTDDAAGDGDTQLPAPSRADVLLLLDRDAEKSPVKRDGASAAGGMWFGPRMGRATDDQNVSPGMWFGPRMGRAAGGEDRTQASSGMWFGPRMGRATSAEEQPFSPGMWFGPRMGRSTATDEQNRQVATGMWFGPRMGRSGRTTAGAGDATRREHDLSSGMWFGPRMGRSAAASGVAQGGRRGADDVLLVFRRRQPADQAPGSGAQRPQELASGMWFGPRMGRRRDADWAGKRGPDSPEGMWFGPRLG